MEKTKNFNVPVWTGVAVEFEKWCDGVSGKKGEKLAGALRAIQAIYALDSGLAHELMKPVLSIEKAVTLIRETLVQNEYQASFDAMTQSERDKLFQGRLPVKDTPAGKEKGGRRR
jgi:hypothetical protein